jgi:hypothetical protein
VRYPPTRRSRKRSSRDRRVGAGRRLEVQVDTVDMVDKSSFGTEMEGTKSMARFEERVCTEGECSRYYSS